MLRTFERGASVNQTLELIEKRREKDRVVRDYREAFLESPLSTAIDFCFHDAEKWLYNQETLKNFRRYLNELGETYNIIYLDAPVERLRKESELVIDRMQMNTALSNMQKKLRMHALIFLFKFLEKETGGAIKGLQMPQELSKLPAAREEGKVASSHDETHLILEAAKKVSQRDYLILKMIFETEQPLQKILSLKPEDINFADGIVQGSYRISVELTQSLKGYIATTENIRDGSENLFISNQGNPLYRTQVQKTLDKANQAVHLPYRITTKMLQRSKQSEKNNWET